MTISARPVVRLASIGLGWWGQVLARAADRTGRCSIVACYARSEQARRAFADEFGCREATSLDEVLADPDVDGLLIATPHSTHAGLVERGAGAGKHLFVEKPLTLTVEEGRAAAAHAATAGVVLQVGHHRRRMPATRELKRIIAAGDLGEIFGADATYHIPMGPRPGWRGDPSESPAGAMTALGVHMVDNLHYLIGNVSRLTAVTTSIIDEHALDDVTTVLFEFERGVAATLSTSLLLPTKIQVGVFGAEASAWSTRDGRCLELYRSGAEGPEIREVDGPDPVVEQLAEFAGCIVDGAKPEVGAAESLDVVAVLEAIVASSAAAETVEVAVPSDIMSR